MISRSLAVQCITKMTGSQAYTMQTASFSSLDSQDIINEKRGSKRIVTLNRPNALNALNLNMVRQLYPLFKEWNNSSEVSIVIIKGAGGKSFCSGGDVISVTDSGRDALAGGSATVHKDFFREEFHLNYLIGTLRKPYVALIDGITMGGGCGISILGRFRVATERTILSLPEAALGFFPDVGCGYFLPRINDNLGMFLALTTFRLHGVDAFHSGLATHYVNSSNLPKLEERLVSLENTDEKSVDDAIRQFQPNSLPPFSLADKLPIIKDAFQAKTVEDIIGKLEKEGSEWSKKQISTLLKMSPTSLKVTLSQMKQGREMSLAQVLTMEYRVSQRFFENNDLYEGCRAILIDKDRNPKWKPATLSEVSNAKVESYFQPLPQELGLREETCMI